MKKHAILAAVMALVAMAAVPAMASAVTLTRAKGVPVKEGDPVGASSGNLVFTGNNGVKLECTESRFSGKVASTLTTVNIESAFFTTNNGACGTNVAGLTADVTAVGLPWVLHFNPEDKWVLTHPRFTVTFTQGLTSVGHCTFTAESVSGTYTTKSPIALTVTEANFVRVEPFDEGCTATSGTLTGSAAVSGIVEIDK